MEKITNCIEMRRNDLIDFLKWFQIRIDKSICENEEEIIELYFNQRGIENDKVCLPRYCECGEQLIYGGYCRLCDNDVYEKD